MIASVNSFFGVFIVHTSERLFEPALEKSSDRRESRSGAETDDRSISFDFNLALDIAIHGHRQQNFRFADIDFNLIAILLA